MALQCWRGHIALSTTSVNGVTYCAEHPPDAEGQQDPPRRGHCAWYGGHGPATVWTVPLDGRDYCADHLFRILTLATWPRPIQRVAE